MPRGGSERSMRNLISFRKMQEEIGDLAKVEDCRVRRLVLERKVKEEEGGGDDDDANGFGNRGSECGRRRSKL